MSSVQNQTPNNHALSSLLLRFLLKSQCVSRVAILPFSDCQDHSGLLPTLWNPFSSSERGAAEGMGQSPSELLHPQRGNWTCCHAFYSVQQEQLWRQVWEEEQGKEPWDSGWMGLYFRDAQFTLQHLKLILSIVGPPKGHPAFCFSLRHLCLFPPFVGTFMSQLDVWLLPSGHSTFIIQSQVNSPRWVSACSTVLGSLSPAAYHTGVPGALCHAAYGVGFPRRDKVESLSFLFL